MCCAAEDKFQRNSQKLDLRMFVQSERTPDLRERPPRASFVQGQRAMTLSKLVKLNVAAETAHQRISVCELAKKKKNMLVFVSASMKKAAWMQRPTFGVPIWRSRRAPPRIQLDLGTNNKTHCSETRWSLLRLSQDLVGGRTPRLDSGDRISCAKSKVSNHNCW